MHCDSTHPFIVYRQGAKASRGLCKLDLPFSGCSLWLGAGAGRLAGSWGRRSFDPRFRFRGRPLSPRLRLRLRRGRSALGCGCGRSTLGSGFGAGCSTRGCGLVAGCSIRGFGFGVSSGRRFSARGSSFSGAVLHAAWPRPGDPVWEPRASWAERGPCRVPRLASPQSERWEASRWPGRVCSPVARLWEPPHGSPASAAAQTSADPSDRNGPSGHGSVGREHHRQQGTACTMTSTPSPAEVVLFTLAEPPLLRD